MFHVEHRRLLGLNRNQLGLDDEIVREPEADDRF
jgi:hypothetical protein